MKDDIKLPPLPKGDIDADTYPVMWVHTDQQMENYAREAIKADRKRRGEPEGWQLVPKEPTEEMLVDAMEASLLGRPSADDDSYVRSIVKAWCAAAPKFGEEK